MEYFRCVLRRHLIKKFKDVGANALFNSFFGEIPNFVSASLAILHISICFPVRVSQLKSEYFVLSNHQTESTADELEHLESFCSTSALEARRRIPASFTIPASLLYCPISQSGLTSFV